MLVWFRKYWQYSFLLLFDLWPNAVKYRNHWLGLYVVRPGAPGLQRSCRCWASHCFLPCHAPRTLSIMAPDLSANKLWRLHPLRSFPAPPWLWLMQPRFTTVTPALCSGLAATVQPFYSKAETGTNWSPCVWRTSSLPEAMNTNCTSWQRLKARVLEASTPAGNT